MVGTYKLTPHNPHPVTGFINAVIGWRFSGATVLDVFEGIRTIQRAGWTWDIHPDPDDTDLQRMAITPAEPRSNVVPILVHNGDWFVLGDTIDVLEGDDVAAGYTVEKIALPPPPEPVEPEPEAADL